MPLPPVFATSTTATGNAAASKGSSEAKIAAWDEIQVRENDASSGPDPMTVPPANGHKVVLQGSRSGKWVNLKKCKSKKAKKLKLRCRSAVPGSAVSDAAAVEGVVQVEEQLVGGDVYWVGGLWFISFSCRVIVFCLRVHIVGCVDFSCFAPLDGFSATVSVSCVIM